MNRRIITLSIAFLLLTFCGMLVYIVGNYVHLNPFVTVGESIDELDGVKVYYNGGMNHSEEERHLTSDGYNLGLKYQCVEFVKRYYYKVYQHKMPNSYGHAKSFFDVDLSDGELNPQRNLIQFSNNSMTKPQKGDLVIMDATKWNRFGHVAIISEVVDLQIEIIQQNSGSFGSSRSRIFLSLSEQGTWKIKEDRVLGWLRIKFSNLTVSSE